MMYKRKRRQYTKVKWLVNPQSIKAEIKKNPILKSYLGYWIKSSRVSGWGRSCGYIQIDTFAVDWKNIRRTDYADYNESIFSCKILLSAENDYSKKGWEEKHLEEIKKIAEKFNIELKIIN